LEKACEYPLSFQILLRQSRSYLIIHSQLSIKTPPDGGGGAADAARGLRTDRCGSFFPFTFPPQQPVACPLIFPAL